MRHINGAQVKYMEEKRWQNIERIVDGALELEDSREREIYIRKACRNDLALYEEVTSLLDAIYEATQNGFME